MSHATRLDTSVVPLVTNVSYAANTHLPEVTRVVLVHHNPVVVLATGVTATGRVLAMLADTTVPRGHVTALLTVFVGLFTGRMVVGRYVSLVLRSNASSTSRRKGSGDRVAGARKPNPRWATRGTAKTRTRAGHRGKQPPRCDIRVARWRGDQGVC